MVEIKCESRLDISMSESFKNDLIKALDGNEAIEIDTANVEYADTAVMQLFTAFSIKAKEQSMDVQWKQPSDAFISSANLLGLTDLLGVNPG